MKNMKMAWKVGPETEFEIARARSVGLLVGIEIVGWEGGRTGCEENG